MMQRKILVPSRRRQQTDSQLQDDLYFENHIEIYEIDDLTSLLAKRLKFENQEDGTNESNKVKRCCFSDEKFIHYNPGLEILSKQQQKSIIPDEKLYTKQVNQLNCGEKKSFQIKNLNEFKQIFIGEIDYIEQIEYTNVQKTLKFKKRKGNSQITKKIHKF